MWIFSERVNIFGDVIGMEEVYDRKDTIIYLYLNVEELDKRKEKECCENNDRVR